MRIENSFYGKQAISEFTLENNLVLEVITMKRFSGNVATSFQVWRKVSESLRETAFNFEGRFINHGKVRMTEKNLINLHLSTIRDNDVLNKNFIKSEINKF